MPESPTTPTQTPRIEIPEVRPQAGPLPSKRGEIGYQEGLHGAAIRSPSRSRTPTSPLPTRHPADREASVTARVDLEGPDAPPTASANGPANPEDASTPSIHKPRWKPSKIMGVRVTTLATFVIQVLLIAVTITGWVFATEKLSFAGTQDSNGTSLSFSGSSAIFIHVLFGVLIVVQLIFLERRAFVIRAERFMYLHPGEILPTHRQGQFSNVPGMSMGYAPWNRPSLPTYAAALMQSGWGTGDVEDHVIAQPPPPAYGHTRGSTLLLSGFLRNSQITSRPMSVGSVSSQMTERGAVAARGRPVSYVSVNGGWVEVRHRASEESLVGDARRSMMLEQTLLALERPQPAVLRPETRT